MPPEPKASPPHLADWVRAQHPGYTADFVEAQYVQSDAWNGTVYLFDLHRPNTTKAVSLLQGYAFALDQFEETAEWFWEFQGPMTPSAKAAVLRVLRAKS